MITLDELKQFSSKVDMSLLRKMIPMKSSIQRDVLPLLTRQEEMDIVASRKNEQVINKLARLAADHYRQSPNNATMYCLCMSVGTIIKEFEWGTEYIKPEGMYKLAQKIYQY